MALEHVGYIDFPSHAATGGFDHAAVHGPRGRLYVAHTANDSVDIVDCATNTYLRSVSNLPRVAGALVSEAHDLVFTSNRGENTVGIFSAAREEPVEKVKVGIGPNGLAYSADHRLLLAANVGDPARLGSFSVSLVDVSARVLIADIRVPGRTRWAMFDAESGRFTSTSPIRPRSWSWTAPSRRGSPTRFRCRRRGRMGSSSTQRPDVCSAPATARSYWRSTHGPVPWRAGNLSRECPTSSFSTPHSGTSTSRSVIRA